MSDRLRALRERAAERTRTMSSEPDTGPEATERGAESAAWMQLQLQTEALRGEEA